MEPMRYLCVTRHLYCRVFKLGFKGQSHMFGLGLFNQKIKQKNNFWVSLGHLSIFLSDVVNSFLKNAPITHLKFVETRPRDNKIL